MLRTPGSIRQMIQSHNVSTLRNHVHTIQQLRAYTTVTVSQHRVQARGGRGLFDQESSDDTLLWKTQAKAVGKEEYTHKHVCLDTTRPTPEEGVVPPGFVTCLINGIPCYHNQQQRSRTSWHGDGSKLAYNQTRAAQAGAAATCGPLQIISRMTGPHDSYRAELQGSVIVTKCARPTDTLIPDNKAVMDYGPLEPTRECANMDVQHQLHDNLTPIPIPVHWIAGHQTVKASHTAQQKTDIKRRKWTDWSRRQRFYHYQTYRRRTCHRYT